jgi:hypothetical protein
MLRSQQPEMGVEKLQRGTQKIISAATKSRTRWFAVRSMRNLNHHLIRCRLGLFALKAQWGALPFLSAS